MISPEMTMVCRKIVRDWPIMHKRINTLAGSHGITYHSDADGNRYAVIGLNFPPRIFADLGNDDYGEIQAIRIYLTGPDKYLL